MTLGEKIRRLRRDRGWTQAEFAAQVGVHERHVLRWEKDRHQPTGRTLEKIAQVFGVPVGDLFDRNEVVDESPEDATLRRQFQEIKALSEDERFAIGMVIDAFLTKRRVEHLVSQPPPRRPKASRPVKTSR